MNHKTRHILLFGFLIVLFAAFNGGCQHHGVSNHEEMDCDSVMWEDSAYQMVQQMDYLYGNNMTDSMELYAPEAMKFCKKHQKWRYYYKIWAYGAMDMVWRGLFIEGVAEAKKMQEDALGRDNAYGQMYAYQVLGIAYSYQNNSSEAAQCFRHALDQCDKIPYAGTKFALYSYYTKALSDMDDNATMDSVLAEWEMEVAAFPVDTADARADVYANWHYKYLLALASHLIATKQYGRVNEVLDSAAYYEEIDGNYPSSLCQLATCRYQYAMGLGDYAEALLQSDEMIRISKDNELSNYILALRFRSEALEAEGNYKEALTDLHKHLELNDSIVASENREQLNMLNKRFEVNELKLQAERDQMKAEERQMMLVILLTMLALVALILFAFYRHYTAVKLKKEHRKLVKAYEQLEVANARAEESSQMKSKFIQQISHEIRTPLNILSGLTQVIMMPDMTFDREERDTFNQGIIENTERITGLVNKMIELSDVSSLTIVERNDVVQVAQIVIEAIKSSGISIAKHLIFERQIPDEVGEMFLTTNRKLAARALALVLDNARKFTAPAETELQSMGGQVTGSLKRASLAVAADASCINFMVEDTGIGIPAEESEHIFEEFVQLDDYYDGTGIGLTVARSLSRKLGGDLILDSSYVEGARFVMTLPLNV